MTGGRANSTRARSSRSSTADPFTAACKRPCLSCACSLPIGTGLSGEIALSNSSELCEKLLIAIKAWAALRPHKSFAGFTVESFQAAAEPSFELRRQVAESEANTRRLIALRD